MLITTIYTRPSKEIPWWTEIMPQEVKDDFQIKWVDTGHHIETSFSYSEDELTMTHLSKWVYNSETFLLFASDPIYNSWKEQRRQYNRAYGIVMVSQTIEYWDDELGETIKIDLDVQN